MRFLKLVRNVYTNSPQQVVRAARTRSRKLLSRLVHPGRRAAILDDAYLARRDRLIRKVIDRVESGASIYKALVGFCATEFDERVLEYPYFVDWLRKEPSNSDLLDMGCVVNSALVRGPLNEECRNIWFCNVSLEPISVDNPVFYHIADLRYAFPRGPAFRLVTCLSTIEHVGFDNSQYGIVGRAEYDRPTNEPLVACVKRIARVTEGDGRVLISVPYGYREAIVHPVTGKIASQVFDFESMSIALNVLRKNGFEARLEVFEIQRDGWTVVDPECCERRYADRCPAAGAVAFLKGRKGGLQG